MKSAESGTRNQGSGMILCEMAGDFLAESQLDREGGFVRNVALLGAVSRNGYRYAAEAMQKATPLYEGRPVFVDHAEISGQRSAISGQPSAVTHRKLRDYAGKVVNPRFESERIRGDLRLLGPNAGWLMGLIEAAPEDIGMSHVVLARRGQSGAEVEQIERVVSVDIVAFPATTRSFAEQQSAGGPISDFRFQIADVNASSGKSEICNPQSEIVEMVEESRLPPALRTVALRELLCGCADPKGTLALLEDYWQKSLTEAPRSPERLAQEASRRWQSPQYRKAMMAAVRGE